MEGNIPPIKDFVERTIRLALGNPVMLLCEKEKQIKEDAMEIGLADYYRLCPYILRSFHNISGLEGTNLSLSFQEIINKLPEKVQPYAYYIGILRHDVNIGMSYQGLYSFDNYLLGTPLINPLAAYSGCGNLFSRTDFPLKQLAYTTTTDLTTGEAQYTIDRVNNCINWVLPVTIGQLNVEHALGFKCWDVVPYDHADMLSKFICKRLLESIITSRTSVQLKSDYTIDVSALKEQLNEINKFIEEQGKLYRIDGMVWG